LINVLGAGAFLVCPNILTRPLAGQNPARALAYAHTLFNLGGLLLWPLLPNLAGLLERVSKGEERQR
jgi:Na+/phosphate symporter